MHPEPISGDVANGVVQRFDVHGHATAKLGGVHPCVRGVAAHGQVRAVELHGDASGRNRFILVTHRLRDRVDVLLVGGVPLVAEEERDHARRRRAHEHLRLVRALHRSLEVGDVNRHGIEVLDGDLTGAGRSGALATARIGRHHLRAAGKVVQVREEVLLDGFATEAVQSVLYVGRVAGLRHLSVVDDRDPGLSLPLDHLLDRTSDPAGERCFVDGDAVPVGPHHLNEIVGPGQAARVRGQDSIDNRAHPGFLPPVGVATPPVTGLR